MFRVLILVPWERFHLVTAHGVSELIVLEENAKAMSLSTLICTVIPRTELEYECYEPWVSFLSYFKGLLHPQNFISSKSL